MSASGPADVRGGLLTALVTTFNEEANIQDCLTSLSFADEILVVDSFSTDRTVEIAKSIPKARVLQHEYAGNGPQCNWGMERAVNPWVLIVDADERVTPELAREIGRLLAKGPPSDLFFVPRRNVFLGRLIRHSGWGRDRLLRFLRRGAARYPKRRVHSDIEAPPGTPCLSSPLLHFAVRSLPEYLAKLHRYAKWGAADLFDKGRRGGFFQIAFRPTWRFVRTYLFDAGFLDGIPGLLVCALQSYGTFLKWSLLWELGRQRSSGRGEPTVPSERIPPLT